MTPIEITKEQFVVQRQGNEVVVTIESAQFNVVIERGVSVFNITQGSGTASVIAAEALGGHRVVTMSGNYASKDNADDKFNILGITQGAVISGGTATVTTYGVITESSWNWTAGLPVFLSTNGQLTQSAPTSGFRLIIGRAKSATTLFVDISEPIVII